jgi:hypothetical protein
MPQRAASEPITIRTDKVAAIDALASAMERSRNYVVNQAIEQYLEANAWQMERIADSDLIRPPIPTRSRPGFRFDVGHRSDLKPATIPR